VARSLQYARAMSTAQFRLLAVCCWLAALCLAIFAAVTISDYCEFQFGDRATAKVVRIDGRYAVLGYDDQGRHEELNVRAAGRHVGDTVTLLVQSANRQVRTQETNRFPAIATGVLALALGLTIWLGVWLWRRPIVAARRRATRTGPLDSIVDAVARTRNLSFGLGAFLVAAAGFFVLIMVSDPEAKAKTGLLVGCGALTAVTLGAGVLILRRGYLLRDPRRNPIMELIEDRPHEIGWIYVHRVVNRGIETLSIHMWNRAGKNAPLAVVREDIDAVFTDLVRRAPDALQGYSKEHKRAYKERVAQRAM
jgi:hypothetical protein